MRVLILHNRYRQPGGEDEVVRAELRMLREHGVDVLEHQVENGSAGIRSALSSAWSSASYQNVRDLCRKFQPHVAHMHNFWFELTPSVHAACRESGAATVQTLHNFRLLCVNALFLRNGEVCEDCLGKAPWRGVTRRCYLNSFTASAAVARMVIHNRRRGTWQQDVDAFIILSRAAMTRFRAAGFAPERLFLKPNFTEDPGEPQSPPSSGDAVAFAGRLSHEKGIATLVAAWRTGNLGQHGRLVIAGDGPERRRLEDQAAGVAGITFLGRIGSDRVSDLYRTARAVALPSICFEQFPRGVVEAFSHARPLVVSDIGGVGELVEHGVHGRKFPPKDAAALADNLKLLLVNGEMADRLGQAARQEYLQKYTADINFRALTKIYEKAVDNRRSGSRSFAFIPA